MKIKPQKNLLTFSRYFSANLTTRPRSRSATSEKSDNLNITFIRSISFGNKLTVMIGAGVRQSALW